MLLYVGQYSMIVANTCENITSLAEVTKRKCRVMKTKTEKVFFLIYAKHTALSSNWNAPNILIGWGWGVNTTSSSLACTLQKWRGVLKIKAAWFYTLTHRNYSLIALHGVFISELGQEENLCVRNYTGRHCLPYNSFSESAHKKTELANANWCKYPQYAPKCEW